MGRLATKGSGSRLLFAVGHNKDASHLLDLGNHVVEGLDGNSFRVYCDVDFDVLVADEPRRHGARDQISRLKVLKYANRNAGLGLNKRP